MRGRASVAIELSDEERSFLEAQLRRHKAERSLSDQESEEEIYIHAQKDMNTGIRNNRAEHIGGNDHRQVIRNATDLVMGMRAEYSVLGKIMSSGGTLSISTGVSSHVAALRPGFFETGGTIARDFTNLLVDAQDIRSFDPGSIVMSSGADMALRTNGELFVGAQESVSISATESITAASSESIRLSAVGDMISNSNGNMIMASDGAMIMRCGKSEIILQPNGDITIKGNILTMEGKRICLN